MTEAAPPTPGAPPAPSRAIALPAFSLSGGPLYALGQRLGLVRRNGDALTLGVALGWAPWLILVALAAAQGEAGKLLSLTVLAGHVRLLIVIPLLFLCESALNAHGRDFVALLVRSGVVPRESFPALEANIQGAARWSGSWIPDVVALLAAALTSYFAGALPMTGKTAALAPAKFFTDIPLAASFYWLFVLPMFRFVLFRFLWRLILWWRFLWGLSRMPLHLVPTHPDGVAGLGYLEVVHRRLAPLAFAISVLAAAGFAEEIATGRSVFDVIYPEMALTIIVVILLILGPPFIFAFKLRACQERGLFDYTALASKYVSDFERKWIAAPSPERERETLLGSSDVQSLADLGASFSVVREMRFAPVSMRLFAIIFAAAATPMLPIFLFKYPLADLVKKLLMKLTGL